MNILQVNSGLGWSGGQYHVLLLSRGLKREGHRVTVACSPKSPLATLAAKEGIPTALVRMRRWWNPIDISRLRSIIRQNKIDLVNTHKPTPHTLAWIAAAGLGVKIVATRHVSFPLRKYPFNTTKWTRGVHGIIAASQSVADILVASGIPSDRIKVIYCPLDSDRFHAGVSGSAVRKEWGFGPDDPVIGQVGELRHWKGYDDFIRAAAMILREKQNAHFLAVGNKTKSYEALVKLARELGVLDRIHFTGFRSEVENYYAAMTVCVSSSTAGEAAPYALKEPLSIGIPVVATKVGGNGEVVIDGENGFLVPPSNPEAMSEAVLTLLRDPELRSRMAENGKRSVKDRFSIEATVKQTQGLYQTILSNP